MKEDILAKLTPRVKLRLRNLVSLYITLENQEKVGAFLSVTKKHIVNSIVKTNEEDPIEDLWPFNTIAMKNVWVYDSDQPSMDLFSGIDVKEFFKLYKDFLSAILDFEKKEGQYNELKSKQRKQRFRWMEDNVTELNTEVLETAFNQCHAAKLKVIGLDLALFNLWSRYM